MCAVRSGPASGVEEFHTFLHATFLPHDERVANAQRDAFAISVLPKPQAMSVASAFVFALGVLPKPQRLESTGKQASLSAEFQFTVTGLDSALLQGAFKRYTSILATFTDAMDGASQAHLRSLDWLRASGVVGDAEHSELVARVHRSGNSAKTRHDSATGVSLTGCSVNVHSNASIKTLSTDESYTLNILTGTGAGAGAGAGGGTDETGCTIDAPTVYGAMYLSLIHI